MRLSILVSTLLAAALCASADDPVVFKSDVALTRVDAQVLDRSGRAVTGLTVDDFVLRVNGKVTPIRNFASENMPLDVLLLLDVSGSMEPHVERIASAAQEALNVLAERDRVAIMVFDTSTRVRLPFKSNHSEIASGLKHVLRSESFHGGTRITYAMISAAHYLEREARPEARRAIVILTDDQTQDDEDEVRVENALAHANAILSFLQAPYEPPTLGGHGGGGRHGTWGGGGGIPGGGIPGGGGTGWPGGGGGGWPGGRGGRGGYGGGDRSHTAGTDEIAQQTGGDTIQVDEASALEDTLQRLRQRYALHFYLPEGSKDGEQPRVKVTLSQEAGLRYMEAEVRYRQIHFGGTENERAGPTVVSRQPEPLTGGGASSSGQSAPDADSSSGSSSAPRRRVAVNEDDSEPRINMIGDDPDAPAAPDSTARPKPAGSGSAQPPSGANASPAKPSTGATPSAAGWPRADGQNPKPGSSSNPNQ